MRTPTVMIIGMVLAPCGLVLNLTSTVAPAWRTLSSLVNRPTDVILTQGIWDICQETTTNQNEQCGVQNSDYFSQQVVQVARALMITSLIVSCLGIALASWGVRCWEDVPHYLISGIGGLVIFISGILTLIPIAWYNNRMYNMPDQDGQQNTAVGYALVLGYLGSCLEIIGGFSLMLCFVPPCKKYMKNRGKPTSAMYYSKNQPSYKEKPISHVYSIQNSDHPSNQLRYSIQNDNYEHSKKGTSVASSPKSYTNPMDVTAGEHPRRYGRPESPTGEHPRRYGRPESPAGEHSRRYGRPESPTGEHPRRYGRPESQLSSLPCDSDLL